MLVCYYEPVGRDSCLLRESALSDPRDIVDRYGARVYTIGMSAGGTMKGLFCIVIGLLGLCVATVATAAEKQLVGWIEKVRILPGNLIISAKIDTGADNSSLHVNDFTLVVRGNEQWVRFSVTDDDGKEHSFERKLVRVAKIKRHSGPRQERPVVMLEICIGKFRREAQVNLVDRSKFKYPLLIGRSFSANALEVDPGGKYTVEPDCPGVTR